MTIPVKPLLLSAALLTTACGGAEPAPQTVDDTGAAPAGAPPTAEQSTPAAQAAERGSGTLRLGDATYEFSVLACDFSGETDDEYQTVSGRGSTPDGERFDVFASRNDVGGMLVHTVSFQTGDVLRGEGTVIEAQRMRHGDSWMSVRGGPSEPLIRIEGGRLTASGRFGQDDAAAEAVDGELEATCR